MAIYFVVVILSAMMKRLVLKASYAGTDHTIMVVSHWYKTMIPGQFTGGTNPFHMTSTSREHSLVPILFFLFCFFDGFNR